MVAALGLVAALGMVSLLALSFPGPVRSYRRTAVIAAIITTERQAMPRRRTLPAADRMPLALLLAACLGMFAASASGTTRAPFLIDMAHDLSTSLPLMGNLVAATSVAWGLASAVAGPLSDRWGRRPFLIGGPAALAVSMMLVAGGDSFVSVAGWAMLAGACSGMFSGPIFAEVSGRVGDGQQGRALGWVMTGQSLTLLVGVPLAALVGSYIGWRGVNICVGVLAVAAAISLALTSSPQAGAGGGHGRAVPSLRAALSGPVLRLMSMGIAERICYGLTAVYYATFLQATYDLPLRDVAVPLAVFATGNILGTIVGGQLADRFSQRLGVFAISMASSGVAALALFGWCPDVTTSVVLGFVYVFLNGIARPSLLASLADTPPHVRGTVMGLNSTAASFGWVGAAGLGGWMMGSYGFAAFGPLAAGMSLLAAALTLGAGRSLR